RGGSDVVSLFEAQVLPQFRANCLRLLGVFITESALNTFTRLPVREGERVLVWFGLVEGAQVTSVSLDRMKAPGNWPALLLELEPTSRSIMGGGRDAARATKHDFDFLHGSWKIRNQYLKERLRHSTEWLEFEAHSEVMPLLDGFGHLDRYSAVRDGAAFEGITLRLFDPETGQWSIHWGGYSARTNSAAADDRAISRRRRRIPWRRECAGRQSAVPLSLDATGRRCCPMGTGLLRGWRQDLGGKLDHDVHSTMTSPQMVWTRRAVS